MFGQVKNLCAFSFCTKLPKNIFDCYSNYSFFLRNCFPLSFLCVFLFVVLFIFTPFNPKMVYSFFISFCVFFLVCVIVLFCHKFKDKESKLQNFTFYDTQKSETSISLNWIKWDESFFFLHSRAFLMGTGRQCQNFIIIRKLGSKWLTRMTLKIIGALMNSNSP